MVDRDLRKRLITAGVLIALVLLLLYLSQHSCHVQAIMAGFVMVTVLLAAVEFSWFANSQARFSYRALLYVVILSTTPLLVFSKGLALLSCWQGYDSLQLSVIYMLAFVSAFLLAALFMIFASSEAMGLAIKISQELYVALLLIGFGGAAIVALALMPHAAAVLLWLLLTVCVNDTAAYFSGRHFKGRKLAPAISPGKTVSGAVGGLLAGILTGCLFAWLLPIQVTLIAVASLAALVVVAAQTGDLLESFLKRLHGVKESGGLLPGHGGILDRLDSLLLAAPVLLCWLLIQG